MVDQAEIQRKAHSEDEVERMDAVRQLKFNFAELINKEQAWHDLIRLTLDEDRKVRNDAIMSLGNVYPHIDDKEYAWRSLFLQIDNYLDNYSGVLSHEILVHMFSVIGGAEWLYDLLKDKCKLMQRSRSSLECRECRYFELKEGCELIDDAKYILQETIKLSNITSNILNVAFPDRDECDYNFEYINIYPIIYNAVCLFREEAKKKNIIINDPIPIGSQFPTIEISKRHIGIVFFNLIHNAVKFSYNTEFNSKNHIEIICKSTKDFYAIAISNYGFGITPEEISKGLIFQKGYRGLLTREARLGGLRIGLSRANNILKAHGGYFKVESQMIDHDKDIYKTTFTVFLPKWRGKRN